MQRHRPWLSKLLLLPALLFLLILLVPDAAYADGELIEYPGREKDIHPMIIGAVLGAVIFVSFKLAGWIANMGRGKDSK